MGSNKPLIKNEKSVKEFMKTVKTKQCKGEPGNVIVTEKPDLSLTKCKNISKN